MPSASREELPLQEVVPGYSSVSPTGAASPSGSRRRTRARTRQRCCAASPTTGARHRTGATSSRGSIVVDYADRQETIVGGQAYYIAPGHRLSFEEESEALEFTPTEALEATLAVARRNAAEAG